MCFDNISNKFQSPTDDPMTLMNKNKNADLNVIVVWSVENEKCKYYIDVKKMLISVSFYEL